MLIRSAPGSGAALPTLHRRLRWVVIVAVVAFAALIVRLWQLQVVRGLYYYEQTVANVVHERYLPSIRGEILDRRGEKLAANRPAFNIYVRPNELDPGSYERLVRLLGLSDAEVAQMEDRIEVARERGQTSAVLVLEDQGRERASLIRQTDYLLSGVEVHDEPYRHYPNGVLAAHLLGYMNQMKSSELEGCAKEGCEATDLVGRYGLERAWENYLRGKKGIEKYASNARGERLSQEEAEGLIEGDPVIAPAAGHDVVLTLDAELQRLAEDAVRVHPAAAVAVVEVDTGRILALVSRPSFDPNVMTGHLTRAEEALLIADPRKPFVDKTLRMHYPPGSTYKIVTAIAALENDLVDPEETFFCPGYHEEGGQKFHCTSSHEKVNLTQAIEHSCNVYFWNLAKRVEMHRMAETAQKLGFGARTGIGLNGDVPGRVPTRAWYEETTTFKIGYTLNAATGQGDVEVTVMQLVMAYAAIANGGDLWVPQVVRRIQTAGGRIVHDYAPKLNRHLDLRDETLELLRTGMYQVVNELGGTAFAHAHSDVVEFAGKTGTAQVRSRRTRYDEFEGWHPGRDHAWFAGYAPADDPEIAIVVLIEHGGPGGKIAAPVAREIIEGYFTTRAEGAGAAGEDADDADAEDPGAGP